MRLLDVITYFLVFGMPLILSFFNTNSRAYISCLRNGRGETHVISSASVRKWSAMGFARCLLFAYLKHFLLHMIVFLLPIFTLPFLYEAAQDIFNEWYLSGSTRITMTLVGFVVIWLPLILLLRNGVMWVRLYYYTISFLMNGLVAFIWWCSL